MAKSREIECVYVDKEKYKKRDRKITAFVSFLKKNEIKFELCERKIIDGYVSSSGENAGTTHGGVIAFAGERKYSDVEEILDVCRRENGFCIYLDGAEDPFNLGYAERALYASGASGLILPDTVRNGASAVLARSSAGASELMKVARFSGSSSREMRLWLVEKAKERGITVCCAAVCKDSVSLFDYDAGFPALVFIGGEKRGISPEFVENADRIVHIPYASSDIRFSLPTATVAALFGFELMRHRRENSKNESID